MLPRACAAASVVDRGVGATWVDATRGLGLPALCLAVLVVTPGCGAELPRQALHEALVGWFQREGIEVDGAECPRSLPRERDASVECLALVGSEEVPVTVVVTDDEGALSVRPRHATVV